MDFITLEKEKNIIYNLNISDFIASNLEQNLSILYFSNKPYQQIENINLYSDKIIYISNDKHNFSGTSLGKIKPSILTHLSNQFVIFIDIDNNVSFKYMEFLIKNLIRLFKILKKHNLSFTYKYNNLSILSILSCNSDMPYFEDLATCFLALLADSKEEMNAIIYDSVCDFLDNEFQSKNLCGFCNNECIASRNGFTRKKLNGCCYSYVYGAGGIILDCPPCIYLNDGHCTANCISCKLHTCYYLKSNNIQFKINDILLLKCFFSLKQHFVLKYNTFKTREEILYKLLHVNSIPFILYLIFSLYKIN